MVQVSCKFSKMKWSMMEYALKDLEGGECAKCAAPPAAKDPDQVDILQPFIDRLPAPSRIGD